ncbi:MAG: TonB-dependent receptor, partial [Bacteroidales bacterium]|nr:TonB-dependent receptor [Candidatus Cryptobacteroides equifaecalis]
IDTSKIYGERKDTLTATVFTARQNGNYLSKGKEIRTEVISAAGLCKMACCNLAESFENSASVTVGYSDAETGARQIRLLGQSGIYTQMLDENRPVMRGLSAPFGLNYVPGQWLESIQIAKGVTSVINGVESMTGQINMEHRKPTDEKPLFLNASVMNDTKCDLNFASAFQFDELATWSTILLGHIDGNFASMDMDGDGFLDDPRQLQFSLANRWLYFGQDGVQVRFGVRAIQDQRRGGQLTEEDRSKVIFSHDHAVQNDPKAPWQAFIKNRSLNSYVKVGVPLNENNSSNIAFVADYTLQDMASTYGAEDRLPQLAHIYYGSNTTADPNPICRVYDATQHSVFANLLYQNQDSDVHHFTLGASEMLDIYNEGWCNFAKPTHTVMSDAGLFGEYTFHKDERFSAIVGLRGDWYNLGGARVSPRLTLKYAPADAWVFRANGGRGIRYSTPLVDNIGVLSTGKVLEGDVLSHPLEDSWTFGGNATWYMPFDESGKTYLSLDYFGTRFTEQMLVENSADRIYFKTLSELGSNAYSYTNNVQLDFSTEPFRGFTLTLTGRYTDAHQSTQFQSDDVKPMTSLYKGVLNLQYATRMNKWTFDFTASVNGPCRVWDFMKDMDVNGKKLYESGYTPVYPLLYAQVTRRFKGFDIYVGGENLTNFRQPSPIINAANPFSSSFDASCIWGPIMGIRAYAGIRVTIWKKA